MKTVSLRELRRTYRHALLVAAPLAVVGCRETTTPVSAEPHPTATTAATPTTPPSATAAPPATATAAKGTCAAEKPNVTGCGGAEVLLHDTPEACGLALKGDLPRDRCDALCAGFQTRACNVSTNRDKKPIVFCHAANPCLGRPMSDGGDEACPSGAAMDVYLAFARRMEALSVDAFHELETDLARFGAPAPLRRACHANAIARLLEARGVRPAPIARRPASSFSSLFALALHNERHGVVGETWGALVAAHQAEHAQDEDVRAAMRAIADEEAEHAALSFRIAAWARTRLSKNDADALDRERRRAFDALAASEGLAPGAARALGWPRAPAVAAMIAVLEPVVAPRSRRDAA